MTGKTSEKQTIAQPSEPVRKIRIQFSKTGNAVYISHLDMLRTFTRAIRRAGIPAAYSQGFNPHLLLTFSMPLSLGTASLTEFADLKLAQDMDDSEIKERLSARMPENIRILEVSGAQRALSEIASSRYRIEFRGDADQQAMLEAGETLLTGKELIVEKKTKRTVKEVDILPFLLENKWKIEGKALILDVRVLSGNEKTLNPNVLIKALKRYVPAFEKLTHLITKTQVYTQDGTDFTAAV